MSLIKFRWAASNCSLLHTLIHLHQIALSACTNITLTAYTYVPGSFVSMFVVNQAWVGSMFSPVCVGTASAFANGWGSAGSGITMLIMPAIHKV